MIAALPERSLRWLQWLTAAVWTLLAASLLMGSPFQTDWAVPGWTARAADLHGQHLAAQPYPIELRLLWSVAVPGFVLIVLILGHDAWRRICPISFFSQIPRRLGLTRKRTAADGSRVVALIDPASWWARHALLVQFALFFAALSLRLVLANSHPLALGLLLVALAMGAFASGLLWGGKTWCHYLCPLAPVQAVYSGPRGLLGRPAQASAAGVSQSMCRDLHDRPTCVGCNQTCPDVDLERHYWERIGHGQRAVVVYGYLGLVAAFFAYLALYGGSAYAGSAFWYEQADPASWSAPGWTIAGHAVAVPRWLAAPVTLLGGALLAIGLGLGSERLLRCGDAVARHRLSTLAALLAFSLLLWLGVLPGLSPLPGWLATAIAAAAFAAAVLWAGRTWSRSAAAWQRESLAGSLRRRLAAMPLDLAGQLDGRRLEDLSADEVWVLGRLLPGAGRQQRDQLYHGVLADAVADGRHRSPAGEAMLASLRRELGIDDEAHRAALAAITAVPSDGGPRLASFRDAVERLLLAHLVAGRSLADALASEAAALTALRSEYAVDAVEAERIARAIAAPDGMVAQAGAALAAQLALVAGDAQALAATGDGSDAWLAAHLRARGESLASQLCGIFEALGAADAACDLAGRAAGFAGFAPADWRTRLAPTVVAALFARGDAPRGDATAARLRLVDDEDAVAALVAARACNRLDAARRAALAAHPALPAFLRPCLDAAPSRQSIVLSISEQGSTRQVRVSSGQATIGRARDNDVVIDHALVSRRHARINAGAQALTLTDLGGINGTMVDGHLVRSATVVLEPGARIAFAAAGGPSLQAGSERIAADDPLDLLLRLASCPVLAGLPRNAVLALAEAATIERPGPGATILAAGEAVGAFRLLLAGSAEVLGPDGVVRGTVQAGTPIGELGVVLGRPASASVRAASPCLIAAIPAARFRDVAARHPAIDRSLLIEVSRRLSAANLAAGRGPDPDATLVTP